MKYIKDTWDNKALLEKFSGSHLKKFNIDLEAKMSALNIEMSSQMNAIERLNQIRHWERQK